MAAYLNSKLYNQSLVSFLSSKLTPHLYALDTAFPREQGQAAAEDCMFVGLNNTMWCGQYFGKQQPNVGLAVMGQMYTMDSRESIQDIWTITSPVFHTTPPFEGLLILCIENVIIQGHHCIWVDITRMNKNNSCETFRSQIISTRTYVHTDIDDAIQPNSIIHICAMKMWTWLQVKCMWFFSINCNTVRNAT